MKKCPKCRVDLTDADLKTGKCQQCGASLAGVVTPTATGDVDNLATLGDLAENSVGDESQADQADSPNVGASDTRKEQEDSRRTIEQDDERRIAGEPLAMQEASGLPPEEPGAPDRTISDIGGTIDELVVEDQRSAISDQRSDEGVPAQDDASKTVADVTKTDEFSSEDRQDAGQTIEESPLSKGDSSKRVVNVNQTVEVPSDDQHDTGRTIQDSSLAADQTDKSAHPTEHEGQTIQDVSADSDAGKAISESPIGGQTVEISEGDPPTGGQTVQDANLEADGGKTISDVPVGGQTIEISEGDQPTGGQTVVMGDQGKAADPSKKTVPDAPINKTVEVPDGLDGTGTVTDVNVNRTVDISGEQPGKPGTVTDRNASPTLDSTEVVSDVAQHINKTWGGSIDDQDTPRTSLKTVVDEPTGTKSDLVIQPRLFGKSDEPRKRASVDYNLLEMLGEGGMGMVYAARQASIDRTVAVKMLKPKTAQDEVQRCKFLAEAVVTGDLEHPNIVPIYDLGRNAEGALFYAMKRVQGTPWDEVISKKSLSENIEILMKVADAIGFSHSRGIIHRDLKPENVMLGDFGEVLVMDWGLAIPTDNRLIAGMQPSTSMGGTPAYMAPEMATGPFHKIGTHSDVYLLGAILFEIVTGKPPHTGKDVMKCLFAAAKNQIQEVDDPNELVEIALKSMCTDSQGRHGSVTEFQDAIRQYLSHSESILLSDHAEKDLATASRTNDYQDFARALFGFQQAVELWDGNDEAKEGLSLTQVAYATCARDKGDFDLGASLLDAEQPNQVELLSEIREARREVEARQHRLKTLKRAIMALAALFVIGVTVALVAVMSAQAETERQRVIAVANLTKAIEQEALAKKNEAEALKQKGIAEGNLALAKAAEAEALKQKGIAETNATEALKQKGIAENNLKLARIAEAEALKQKGIAEKKKIEAETNFKLAKAAEAEALKQKGIAETNATEALKQKGIAENNLKLAKIAEAEALKQKGIAEKKKIEAETNFKLAKAAEAEALKQKGIAETNATEALKQKGIAENNFKLAKIAEAEAVKQKGIAETNEAEAVKQKGIAETNLELAKIAEAEANRQRDRAEQQAYIALISAAAAKIDENAFDSARQLLQECAEDYRNWEWGRLWHVCNQSAGERGAGAEIAATKFNPDVADQFATGSLDGKVRLWTLKDDMQDSMRVPTFDTGNEEVFAIAYSPHGKYMAVGTGTSDGFLQIWDVENQTRIANIPSGNRDDKLSPHSQDIVSVQFDSTGNLLLTSSLDSTAKVWDVTDKTQPTVRTTMKGHTWWVWSASFSPNGEQILTVSDDGNAIVWTDRTGQWTEELNIKASPKFRGHAGPIFAGTFSPDGETVATAGYGQRILLWRPGNLKEFDHEAAAAKFDPNRPGTANASVKVTALDGHTGPIRTLTFSNDGAALVSAGEDNTIRVWDIHHDGKSVVLRGHGKAVQGCDISPDNNWIVSGSLDGKARIWDLSDYKEQRVLRGDVIDAHEDAVLSADFSSDGKQIVTASRDGTAKTWDPDDLAIKKTFKEGHTLREGHLFRAARAQFFADDKYLATSSVDNTVRIWDVSRGTQIDSINNSGRNAALAISSDGSLIVTGSADGFYAQVWKWDREREKVLGWNQKDMSEEAQDPLKLGGHTKTVTQVAVSADKRFIATGDANGGCNLWDAQRGKLIRELRWHQNGITALAFLPDSTQLLTGDSNGFVYQWGLKLDQPSKKLMQLTKGPDQGVAVASMAAARIPGRDIRAVVVCSDDGRVELYDVDRPTRNKIRSLDPKHPFGIPDDVSFSPDGSRIMVVASPSDSPSHGRTEEERARNAAAVHLFESVSGREIEFRVTQQDKGPFLYLGRNGAVSSATFNSDGSRIVAVGGNRARVWKVDPDLELAKREVMRFRPHGPIATARFSPDDESRYIITGSWDTTIKIWDTKTNKNTLTEKNLHSRAVNSVQIFEHEGKALGLSASDDGTAKLWRFDPDEGTVETLAAFAHPNGVTDAIYIPRRNPITTSYLVGLFFGDALPPAFVPPRDLIATSSRDGAVRIWEIPKAKVESPIVRPVRTLSTPDAQSSELLCVAASYDGQWIVAGGEKDAKIWDLDASGAGPVFTMSGHTAPVTCVEFSGAADHSHRLLTGSKDFTAKVWDTSKLWEATRESKETRSENKSSDKLTEIMTLKGHTRAVTSVTFSPDGRDCLTGSEDGTAIVWLTSWPDEKPVDAAE